MTDTNWTHFRPTTKKQNTKGPSDCKDGPLQFEPLVRAGRDDAGSASNLVMYPEHFGPHTVVAMTQAVMTVETRF